MAVQLKCIMIIDDNKIDNFFHERIIKKRNITSNIIIKESAPEALSYLNENLDSVPELIFLDIHMPEMTGWEFLEHFKKIKNSSNIKVIVMLGTTAYATDNADKFKSQLNLDFHTKPLTSEILDTVISNL